MHAQMNDIVIFVRLVFHMMALLDTLNLLNCICLVVFREYFICFELSLELKVWLNYVKDLISFFTMIFTLWALILANMYRCFIGLVLMFVFFTKRVFIDHICPQQRLIHLFEGI